MDQNILTTIFGIFGDIGVLFGIYKHFSTLKSAKLIYEVKEISEFKLPKEFYKDISSIPISIEIENIGNKNATNILLKIELETRILTQKADSVEELQITKNENEIIVKTQNLNPSETIDVSFFLTSYRYPCGKPRHT